MTPRIINDHIVLPVQGTGQLRALFPGLKETQIGEQIFAAVPFTLEAARIFNNLGIKTPSPIRAQYEWPGRYKPRWYQTDTAEFFTLNTRAHCHSAPRTGKTLSALWAADYLRQAGNIKRTLIVAPLSTLWDVWETNIFESFPLRTFCVLHGSRKKRLELLAQPHDFYIINHHGVQMLEQELASRPDIDLVVIDEVATLRNPKAKTIFKPMNNVLNHQGIVRACWGLTGTPTPNDPTDAFGQCKLVTPENYRGHFTSWKNETMMQLGQFKWVPRKGSAESVARILKPSIRFERSVCTDMEPCFIERRAQLSEEQAKAYKQLIQLAMTEIRGATVTAVNAAVLISKLVQTACISSNTMVLSLRGWVPIQNILASDKVWDGEEWVSHAGVVFNGIRDVVDCGGIRLTHDHGMLTESGWRTAQEINDGNASNGLNWAAVRLPKGLEPGRINVRQNEMRTVEMPLRLREGGNSSESEPAEEDSTERETLRVQVRGACDNPRDDAHQAVQYMGQDASSLPLQVSEGLQKLRSAWDNCMSAMEAFIRAVLGGYEGRILEGADARSKRQQRPVLPRELSMGIRGTAGKQQEDKHTYRDAPRGDVCSASSKTSQHIQACCVPKTQVRLASESSTGNPCGLQEQHSEVAPVYDIINCGPRNRFVVRGASGDHRIVHNCGCVIAADGSIVKMDYGPRLAVLEELIEENNEKVLVFVPFTGVLDALAVELRKRWTVAVVDGGVSASKRTQIFRDFRSNKDPHIILAHPGTMAHGLDLTAASLSIWYAPYWRPEYYQQANARTDGSRQTAKIDIAHIYATAEERRIYSVLKERGRLQDVVLSLSSSGGNQI